MCSPTNGFHVDVRSICWGSFASFSLHFWHSQASIHPSVVKDRTNCMLLCVNVDTLRWHWYVWGNGHCPIHIQINHNKQTKTKVKWNDKCRSETLLSSRTTKNTDEWMAECSGRRKRRNDGWAKKNVSDIVRIAIRLRMDGMDNRKCEWEKFKCISWQILVNFARFRRRKLLVAAVV